MRYHLVNGRLQGDLTKTKPAKYSSEVSFFPHRMHFLCHMETGDWGSLSGLLIVNCYYFTEYLLPKCERWRAVARPENLLPDDRIQKQHWQSVVLIELGPLMTIDMHVHKRFVMSTSTAISCWSRASTTCAPSPKCKNQRSSGACSQAPRWPEPACADMHSAGSGGVVWLHREITRQYAVGQTMLIELNT